MDSTIWLSLIIAFWGGLIASFLIDTRIRPHAVPFWRRPEAANCAHVGTWVLVFAVVLALFRRPCFSVANVLLLQVILLLVNNAKYRALREVFVFADIEYFRDTLRYPRLYLPFFGITLTALLSGGYILALWGAIKWEPALAVNTQEQALIFSGYIVALAAIGVILASIGSRLLIPQMRFDANDDLRAFGMFACLCGYARAERQYPEALWHNTPFAVDEQAESTPSEAETDLAEANAGAAVTEGNPFQEVGLPDLIAIQSESFFDPRAYAPQLRPDLLGAYDWMREQSLCHGHLTVPAWGANTIRTEFAFLTGLPPERLGVHRYNPYRSLMHRDVPSLPNLLRAKGYRTICIHPFHRGFYGRNRILPRLGFDQFLDLSLFSDADYAGPYVGDCAVMARVVAMLRGTDMRPLYIHIITMENHGPLHWEKVSPDEAATLSSCKLPPDYDDLLVYARHLRNADAALVMLLQILTEDGCRATSVCLFGDHVPIMPKVYEKIGAPDGRTNYLIWRNDVAGIGLPRNLSAHELAGAWLDEMGVNFGD